MKPIDILNAMRGGDYSIMVIKKDGNWGASAHVRHDMEYIEFSKEREKARRIVRERPDDTIVDSISVDGKNHILTICFRER